MWEISSQFWASRNAFSGATMARQSKAAPKAVAASGGFRVPTLQEQKDRWAYRTQFGGLSAGIKAPTLDVKADGATTLVRRLITRVVPALTEVFDREMGAAANNALFAWPVSSGYSKAAITLGYSTVGDTEFVASIGNAAPYAIYIKGSPWNKLIRQPAKQAATNIASSLRIGE